MKIQLLYDKYIGLTITEFHSFQIIKKDSNYMLLSINFQKKKYKVLVTIRKSDPEYISKVAKLISYASRTKYHYSKEIIFKNWDEYFCFYPDKYPED